MQTRVCGDPARKVTCVRSRWCFSICWWRCWRRSLRSGKRPSCFAGSLRKRLSIWQSSQVHAIFASRAQSSGDSIGLAVAARNCCEAMLQELRGCRARRRDLRDPFVDFLDVRNEHRSKFVKLLLREHVLQKLIELLGLGDCAENANDVLDNAGSLFAEPIVVVVFFKLVVLQSVGAASCPSDRSVQPADRREKHRPRGALV